MHVSRMEPLTSAVVGPSRLDIATQPYDVVVCAILLRATLTIPSFVIESDGEWDQAEWANARNLYTSVFGEDPGREPFSDTTGDEDLADED
jgi:hypothetical protein